MFSRLETLHPEPPAALDDLALTQVVVFTRSGVEVAFAGHWAIGLAFVTAQFERGNLLRRLLEAPQAR